MEARDGATERKLQGATLRTSWKWPSSTRTVSRSADLIVAASRLGLAQNKFYVEMLWRPTSQIRLCRAKQDGSVFVNTNEP